MLEKGQYKLVISVDQYGLHYDSNHHIWWLLQPNFNLNAVGVSSEQCPFKLCFNTGKLFVCPHNYTAPNNLLLNNPDVPLITELGLSKFLLPVSDNPYDTSIIYIPTENRSQQMALFMLSQIACINQHGYISATQNNINTVSKLISHSNISRIVIRDIRINNYESIVDSILLNDLYQNSRIILTGSDIPMGGIKSVVSRVNILDNEVNLINSIKNIAMLRSIGSNNIISHMKSVYND